MRTLHLYVLRQVLATLAMTVAVFTGLFLIVNALKEILPLLVRHVPLANVLEVVAMLLPFGLVFALPMGLLTATLLVFGRLGADQELTAVRSGGVSLLSLILPVFGLSVVASGVAAFLNLELAPWCRVRSKELLYELGVARPTALLVEQRFITEFPGWTIYLGKRTGEAEFEQVRLYELKQDQLTQRIHARRGQVTTDPVTRQVLFRLFEAEVFTKSLAGTNGPTGGATTNSAPTGSGEWGMVFFDEAPPVKLDLSGTQPSEGKPKLSEMSFRQLLAELRERRGQGVEVTPVLVHMNRQVSFSFACIGFTLIGIPLGIRGHRRETSFGIAAALGLTAVYYSFIILGQSWEMRPHLHPQLIVWVPNFLFQGIGGWLLWRANRGL
ncbi:MAG: YjgP/YjgQ family permease [Proteobacteria bacterium]|nr:YjgP/YjgQ family permease [Pseudomonadota bacterium]